MGATVRSTKLHPTQFLYQQCLNTSAMPLFILILAKVMSTCHVVNFCGCFTIVKFGEQGENGQMPFLKKKNPVFCQIFQTN